MTEREQALERARQAQQDLLKRNSGVKRSSGETIVGSQEMARARAQAFLPAFTSNDEFRQFLNTSKGFYELGTPSIESPQFKENPISYFDEDAELVNPRLNSALRRAGGSEQEIDFLHSYIGMEDNIRLNSRQYEDGKKGISNLIGKAVQSENPNIWFRPNETLYRGSRAPADKPIPGIGEIVEWDRFRSTTPDPEVAKRFASIDGGFTYLDSDTAKKRFGEGNRGRIEVIEPLRGGLRLGNPLEGEDPEVLLKPGKFKVIDRKTLLRPNFESIEFLKYRQIHGVDPTGAALGGGADLLRRNARGAVTGAALSAANPEVAKQVERGQYGRAAETVGRDVVGGAVAEAALRRAAPAVARAAPAVARIAAPVLSAAAPVLNAATPVVAGAALFNQGRTGSLTDVLARKVSRVIPGLKPDPETDLGRRAGNFLTNETAYAFGQLRSGKLPYSGNKSGRQIGTRAVLGGKPVVWTGDNYGWQSPASAAKVGVR